MTNDKTSAVNQVDANVSVLPANVENYKTTPAFDQDSIPKGLLSEHATKFGTWGVLNIELGTLKYHVLEPGYQATYLLSPGSPGIIAPTHVHRIEAVGEVIFSIAFYRETVGS